MTDYWKSYAKKFCEICKVWYADNKISSERHEMGTKHKIMVQQRLRESSKKARDKEAADHDLRMTLLGMEQAARASLGEGKQRRIPRVPAEEEIADYPTAQLEPEEFDPKADLREQRRMLKDLKTKSKQSQLWVDDNEAKQEVQDTVDEMVWVQAETPGAVRYYWHIYSGETRWDQPKHFYTSEEYAERYTEIAAKIASQNQIIAESAGQLFQLPSSSGTTKQLTSTEQNYSHFHSSQMIAPKYAPEMSTGETDSRGGTKRGPRDDYERGNELSKEERKRIKRERIAMAEAEGPPQKPEGLVELMERPAEEIKPKPIQMNEAEATDTKASTTTNHPFGPWIPVKKKETDPKIESESEQKVKKKKHFDDLPEQGYGPGSSMLANAPAELLEVAEMDPEELAFRPKEVPTVERNKKSSKGIVGFRRPAGNSANKSLRNRAN